MTWSRKRLKECILGYLNEKYPWLLSEVLIVNVISSFYGALIN